MKQTKKQWLTFVLLAALLPGILLVKGASLPSLYGESYYAELAPMTEYLDRAEGPRLIVLGGSSVAFGLKPALLETLLAQHGYSYTVCPFGLYAAIGSSAMLALSSDTLREGDVVVLAIEPDATALSTYFGATSFWKCAEDAMWLLLRLNGSQHSALAGTYLPYLQERAAAVRDGTLPKAEGVYAKASFDDHCAMIYERPGNTMALGWDTSSPVDLAAVTVEDAFAAQLADYCADAKRRGATVLLSFAPVNRSALTDASAEAVETFFATMTAAFPCPVISDPNRYLLESGWFFDNNFHLNSAGATLRTLLLAEDLLAEFGCYAPVDYALPKMPDRAYVLPSEDEGAGDADAFFFDAVFDEALGTSGWLISGLTETGLSRTSLTVPAVYAGRPVTGFLPEALSGADALEELTLPESIEFLPDGLFADCTRLTRLVLLHTSSLCTVTEHTFDDADQLRVYIPREAMALYRDGAGCAVNPWEAYLNRIRSY